MTLMNKLSCTQRSCSSVKLFIKYCLTDETKVNFLEWQENGEELNASLTTCLWLIVQPKDINEVIVG